MHVIVLLFGLASLAISVAAAFRRGAEGVLTSFSCGVAAAAIAVWIAVDLIPAAAGSNRILSALALASFTATAAFWARAGLQVRRRAEQRA